MDTFFALLNDRPEIVLSAFMLVMLPFLMLMKRRPTNTQVLLEFLQKGSGTQEQNQRVVDLIEKLESVKSDGSKKSSFGISKIVTDIEWDVAGLIGVAVTAVLLIAAVSRSTDQIPEQLFTGWLIILGYYFGKSQRSQKATVGE